ncbi:hypothetical protein BYT27DRAFT_7173764 [Phlegmacium glaucopus]|nr:hypothetical protein BYT27DRAFT_7173764 [Phlegmacium glaucopus]
MRSLRYIPQNAKSVLHESRNGILLCPTHRQGFEHHQFYIRWNSEANEFIVINHSRQPAYESIHGKVLHFNTDMKRCPFPTTFLWHEYRVRSFYPTYADRPVTIKKGRLQGSGLSGEPGDAGVRNDGAGGSGGDDSGCGKQVKGH